MARVVNLPIGEAVALGAIQGPTELLPVSSSGHLVLVPALCGWSYRELDPELRKSFEVALHAGGALALLIGLRREVAEYLRTFGPENLVTLTLSFAPAALIASQTTLACVAEHVATSADSAQVVLPADSPAQPAGDESDDTCCALCVACNTCGACHGGMMDSRGEGLRELVRAPRLPGPSASTSTPALGSPADPFRPPIDAA